MAYVKFALICLVFGSNFMLMHRANQWFGPIEVGLGRLLFGAIAIAIVWALFERSARVRFKDLRNLRLVAFIAFACPYALQPALIGMGFGHSFFGTTIVFVPLLTVLVSIPMIGVKPTTRQLIGVLCGLAFALLLLFDGKIRGIPVHILALAFCVPLCYATGNTWIRRTLHDADPTPISCIMMLMAALMLTPFIVVPGLSEAVNAAPPETRVEFTTSIAALIFLGAIGTGACTWMFVRLVQTEGPLFAGMVTYVVPVIAMLWGLGDGERITMPQTIAILGILCMVAIVQAPAKKGSPAVEPIVEPSEIVD